MMMEEPSFQHLELLFGILQSVHILSSSDHQAYHVLKLGLTYDYLYNVKTPTSHLLATLATSWLQQSTETLPAIYFNKLAISCLMNLRAMLNNTCINEGLQFLLSYLQPEHAEYCAIFLAYTMTYIKEEADDLTLWHDVCHCVYWTKAIWILPIHLQHPYLHWSLCIINMGTTTIWLFDSVIDKSCWMNNVKASGITNIYTCYSPNPPQNALNLIVHLQSLAALHNIPFTVPLHDWTATPISADAVQSNSYDCGPGCLQVHLPYSMALMHLDLLKRTCHGSDLFLYPLLCTCPNIHTNIR